MKRYIVLTLAILTSIITLQAREIIPLNDSWKFYFGTAQSADMASRINLPYTWSDATQGGSSQLTGNYLRKIYIPIELSQKRIFVKFYGVHNVATILLNGQYIGEHRGGATAFTMELTNKVKFGTNNELLVMVSGGVQMDIPPISIDHTVESGIYRQVEMITTPKSTISPLYYGSDGVFVTTTEVGNNSAKGSVRVHMLTSGKQTCDLKLNVYNPQGELVARTNTLKVNAQKESADINFTIDNANLWSPSAPSLYRFEVAFAQGDLRDTVEVWSGLRTVSVNSNGKIAINGKEQAIHGVSLYHDHPNAATKLTEREALDDIEFIKELGATAVHSAVVPHPQSYYTLFDSEGVMSWIDMPFSRTSYIADLAYIPSPSFEQSGRNQVREIIAQYYNHPSVIMWGLFSMLQPKGDDIVPYLREINKIIREMDSSRLVAAMSNSNGDMNSLPDLIVWNVNFGWAKGTLGDISIWTQMLHTQWGQMRSAVSYGQAGSFRDQGYAYDNPLAKQGAVRTRDDDGWNEEGAATEFHEAYASHLDADSLMWGVWINNLFDYKSPRSQSGENSRGLVSYDRRDRKDIFYLYKALWNSDQSTFHIAGKRDKFRQQGQNRITLYSSDTLTPQAIVNGRDTAVVRKSGRAQFVIDSLPIALGRNVVKVEQGANCDSIILIGR